MKEDLDELLNYLIENDFTGYDTGSFLIFKNNSKLFLNEKNRLSKKWNQFLNKSIYLLGHRILNIIDIPRVQSTKAIALTLSGLVNLLKIDEQYQGKFEYVFSKLMERRLVNNLWPADFNYIIKGKEVKKGTTGVINTIFSLLAIKECYELTKDMKYKEIYLESVESLIEIVPIKYFSSNKACFSYNPSGEYYVHNANLLILRIMSYAVYLDSSLQNKYIPIIDAGLNYSLDDFKNTNSIPYAGEPTRSFKHDNYHTGYVMESISDIKKFIPILETKYNLNYWEKKILNFYYDNYIGNYVYKFNKNNIIESHSLAQSIIVYKKYYSLLGMKKRKIFNNAIENTLKLLQYKGLYKNKVCNIKGLSIHDNTLMPRWALSWMLYSLSLHQIEDNNDE
ncbi:hypothetical protein [Halarcobacter sp.]|uniref:hypothetical protein n=1 Tax=Halarcobacter sp. TaxID=2321133 RepID=UPI003A945CE1